MPCKIAALSERALIRVGGPDWRPFLHNLLTHDIEGLAPGTIRFTALLTPQGRLLHDLFVHAGESGAVLDVAATGRDGLLKRLTLYKLRAKVGLEPMQGAVHAAWGRPPSQGGWARDPRLPDLGWRSAAYPGPTTAAADDYDAHRLSLGVPDPALDGRDTDYPIELDFDLLNGIDFKKGCFIGQEITSRMKRRGAIKTRAVPLGPRGRTPPPGAEVLSGELRAGEVRSGRDGRAIALLRLDRAQGGALTAGARPVRLDPPPWLADSLGLTS
ncbi:MAG: folate-binding protein [Proteobacteria bacterium]|nr:folate-binding protein [Pseudomonadota bacterium]